VKKIKKLKKLKNENKKKVIIDSKNIK